MGDYHCQRCGEPWSMEHVLHDLPHELDKPVLIAAWQAAVRKGKPPHLHGRQSAAITAALAAVGWKFGSSLASIERCGCCVGRELIEEGLRLRLRAHAETMGHDLDGAAT